MPSKTALGFWTTIRKRIVMTSHTLRHLILLPLVAAGVILLAACGPGDCGRLCDYDFWHDERRGIPTVRDVKAELDRGSKAHGIGYAYGISYTPLHFAVISFVDRDVIELLLDQGAKINAKDGDGGNTALHSAVMLLIDWQVEVLVERGANKRARNDAGETPCEYASEYWGRVNLLTSKIGRLVC